MELILASASPRRLELLKQIEINPDKIIPAEIDETPYRDEQPLSYVKRMAEEKALEVYKENKSSFILAADTIVVLGKRILQKAETEDEARRYLELLSGRRHKVITAITLITPKGKVKNKSVTSVIKFKRLSQDEINSYLISNDWKDKAGAYAIQSLAAKYISFISGSYSNIVGLPLHETYKLLEGADYE